LRALYQLPISLICRTRQSEGPHFAKGAFCLFIQSPQSKRTNMASAVITFWDGIIFHWFGANPTNRGFIGHLRNCGGYCTSCTEGVGWWLLCTACCDSPATASVSSLGTSMVGWLGLHSRRRASASWSHEAEPVECEMVTVIAWASPGAFFGFLRHRNQGN